MKPEYTFRFVRNDKTNNLADAPIFDAFEGSTNTEPERAVTAKSLQAWLFHAMKDDIGVIDSRGVAVTAKLIEIVVRLV